jgi:hypothetical protein
MNTALPHARRAWPLLGMAVVVALAATACHRADDDTMAAPAPASTAMPATTMPAAPSTMTSPMPATSAGAYDAQGTSNEAPPAQSAGMPPPVDTPQDGTRDDAAPTNPATPPGGNH